MLAVAGDGEAGVDLQQGWGLNSGLQDQAGCCTGDSAKSAEPVSHLCLLTSCSGSSSICMNELAQPDIRC